MERMRRANMVSFLGWTQKFDDYSGLKEKNGEGDGVLERTGSGTSVLSAYKRESDSSCDDLKRRIKVDDPGDLRFSEYKDVIFQPNGRLEAQIYQKHQRMCLRNFNEQEYPDIAAFQFRGVHPAATNFKAVEAGHSQGMGVHLGEEKEVKRGQEMEKSDSPSEKEKSSKEHLFDKAVTPSDVGKLNRLVIPKQHAEKYFPLDTNANDKGLLLNFEDSTGKIWRFRYSYWNSSQSYVLTKGWSRFVKEKKLDAGDIVSFERGTDAHNAERRLFISWRRRSTVFQPSKAALLLGYSLPSLTTSPGSQYGPFQSYGLSNRPGVSKLVQRHEPVKALPEWMSAPSRRAPMLAEQIQPPPVAMDMRFYAAEAENFGREPLDFMQLKTHPWPVQNAVVQSSKKGVRLFGVNL